MNRQKSKVLGFFFSLLPGAGHMYLGLMKQGLSYMILFFGVIGLTAVFNFPLIAFITPIIWFYSFFDYLNKMQMDEERFAEVEDKLLFLDGKLPQLKSIKYQKYLGWFAILSGGWMLWDHIINRVLFELAEYWDMPQLLPDNITNILVAIAIVVVGVVLLRGKKKQLLAQKEEEEE